MKFLFMLLALFFFSSCSMNRLVVKTSSPVLEEGGREMETEPNWELFRQGMPAALKTLESFLWVDPHNRSLLRTLIQAYSAYGYGVHETLHWDERYADSVETPAKDQALSAYTKSFTYGVRFLSLEGVQWSELIKLSLQEGEVKKILEENFQEEDLPGIFFLAQAYGGLINLQRDNVALISHLPLVKSLFDFVCEQGPNFQYGACQIFQGTYALGRPKLLGGNPEEGKKILLSAWEKQPLNLLIPLVYLEYAVIPSSDEEEYQRLSLILEKEFGEFRKVLNIGKEVDQQSRFRQAPYLNLFNAIALKRFEILKHRAGNLF